VTTKVVIDEYYLFQYSRVVLLSAPSDADGATARGGAFGAFVAFVFSSRKNVFSPYR